MNYNQINYQRMNKMQFKEIYEIVKQKFTEKDISMIDSDFSAIVHITGEDEGYIYASYIGGNKVIEPVKHNSANILVALSDETFEKLYNKELDPFKAFTTGKIKAKGNVFLAMSLFKKYKNGQK